MNYNPAMLNNKTKEAEAGVLTCRDHCARQQSQVGYAHSFPLSCVCDKAQAGRLVQEGDAVLGVLVQRCRLQQVVGLLPCC